MHIPAHRRTPLRWISRRFDVPRLARLTLNGHTKVELGERWPGLDIRGDGGYAIFIGETNGKKYEWLRDPQPHPFDAMPKDLREFLRLSSKARPSANVKGSGEGREEEN